MEEEKVEVTDNSYETKKVNETSPNEQNSSAKKVSKKKGLKIVLGVFGIIVIALVGSFLYLKLTRTATKYLDTKIAKLEKNVNKTFSNDIVKNMSNFNIFEDDFKLSGNFKINASGDTFKDLDKTEMVFDLDGSIKNHYLGGNFELKDSGTNVNGSLYLDNNNIYLDLKDIYSQVLKSEMEENPFEELMAEINNEEYQKMMDSFKIEDVEYFTSKTLSILKESIKEIETKTESKGLNVIYTYKLNNDGLTKIINKFAELKNKDKKYTDIIEKWQKDFDFHFELENPEINGDVVVTIEVDMLKNKIKDFTLKANNETIISKVAEDTYKIILHEASYLKLLYKDEKYVISMYEDGEKTGVITYSSNDKETMIKYSNSASGLSGRVTFTEVNKKESKVDLEINAIIASVKVSSTMKVDGSKSSTTGKITASIMGMDLGAFGSSSNKIEVSYSVNSELGNNIVNKKTFNNYKDINTLTATESDEIAKKIEEKFTSLNIYKFFNDFSSQFIGGDDAQFELDFDDFEWDIDGADIVEVY